MRKLESRRPQVLLVALVAALSVGVWLALDARPKPASLGPGTTVLERGSDAPDALVPAASPRARAIVALASDAEREALTAPGTSDLALPRGPLRGRVVDIATGAPLSDVTVAVLDVTAARGAELIELASTDAEGRFRTNAALPDGEYVLNALPERCWPWSMLDAQSRVEVPSSSRLLRLDHRHRPGANEREARIALARGPTYRFALTLPPEVDACECTVTLHHELGTTQRSSPPSASLRAGAPTWTRFEERVPIELATRAPPWWITLATADGRYVGSAPVHAVEGECAEEVRLQLTARGALEGVVRGAKGEPARFARVTFEPQRTPRFADHDTRARADDNGRFELRRLPAGPARLMVEADGFATHVEELVVIAGQPREHDVQLPRVVLGDVSGWLHAEGEPLDPVPRILLRRHDAPAGSERLAHVYPSVDGNARFELRDVPPGEYELVVEALGAWDWLPRRQRVQAPAAGIELTRASAPLAMLLLDARAAEDDGPLPRFDVWLETHDGLRHERGEAGSAVVDRVSPERDAVFALSAPGRALVRARVDELAANGRFRSGRFALARGFSARVRTVDDATGEPLAGASVQLDGAECARTDARGEALVSWRALPRTLEVALEAHMLVDDDLSAGRRSLEDPGDALTFRFGKQR